jgi:pimeloyl-ACP methyl ester carboxylesterase
MYDMDAIYIRVLSPCWRWLARFAVLCFLFFPPEGHGCFIRSEPLPKAPDTLSWRNETTQKEGSAPLFPHFDARLSDRSTDGTAIFEIFPRVPIFCAKNGHATITDNFPLGRNLFYGQGLTSEQKFQILGIREEDRQKVESKDLPWRERILRIQYGQRKDSPTVPMAFPVLWRHKEATSYLNPDHASYRIFFFNARSQQKSFNRMSYFLSLDVSGFCVSDITSNNGMWYIGTPDDDYHNRYAGLIRSLIEAEGVPEERVLFMGSSMGGFMALKMAEYFPKASAFAYNPQVDLLTFLESGFLGGGADTEIWKFLTNSLEKLSPNPSLSERKQFMSKQRSHAHKNFNSRISVDISRLIQPASLRFIVYVQNIADTHHLVGQFCLFHQKLQGQGDPFLTALQEYFQRCRTDDAQSLAKALPQYPVIAEAVRQTLKQTAKIADPSGIEIHPGPNFFLADNSTTEKGKEHAPITTGGYELRIIERILQYMSSIPIERGHPPAPKPDEPALPPEAVPAPDELPVAEPPSPGTSGDESETGEPEKPGQKSPEAGAHSDDEPPPPSPS